MNKFFPAAAAARFGLTVSVFAAVAPVWAQKTAAPSVAAPTLAYYGVYLQQAKLGNATMKRDEHAVLNGRPAVQTEMRMVMDLRVLGAPNKVLTNSISWSDPKTGIPLASRSRTESSGRITTVSATYTDHSVSYSADIQGTLKKETLTLKPGEKFLADLSDGASIKPYIGMKLSGKMFSAETMRLVNSEIVVVGQETIAVGGQALRAYKILEKNAMMPSTLYASDAGELLRADLPMGMQLLKEPKEMALAEPAAGSKRPDIVTMTSIAPTGAAMTGAHQAGVITYEIAGVTRPLAPTDTVQTATYQPIRAAEASDKNEKTATVTVRALGLPTAPAAPRFGTAADAAPERLRRFLQATPYVSSTDPEFVQLAQTLVGEETDTAKAAARIAAYVHKTVKPDPGIAALRTAQDIRKEPRGVCRDYTTLFTAIARAAGIPTKQCVGLGYGILSDGVGRFVGHAWPEVWVGADASGADRWVALEPTWGTPFADATHIKLAEGEITDFFDVAADMDHYKIKVLTVQ